LSFTIEDLTEIFDDGIKYRLENRVGKLLHLVKLCGLFNLIPNFFC